jgi:streptogramin lyase
MTCSGQLTCSGQRLRRLVAGVAATSLLPLVVLPPVVLLLVSCAQPQYPIAEFFLLNVNPFGITSGPDGNVWFTEWGVANKIGRITPTGAISDYLIPTANSGPWRLTAGPDGKSLWFTEYSGNKIARITKAGVITDEYLIPTASSNPTGITTGPDGNV